MLVAKILLPKNQTYAQVQEQWRDELDKLIHLRHPNITHVYGAFEFQDTFYILLERCSGSLDNLLRVPNLAGNLWFPHVAQPLLQALQFMHDAGYVHKDIHPGNVFLKWVSDPMVSSKDPVLQVKVGDLGISRLESDINVFHTMLAKWMLPPEALDPGQFGLVGRQVDLYHAGLLFLSILVGKVPSFTVQEVLDGAPRQMAEKLASPYAHVVSWALRRHTSHRPQTALELWRAIRAIQLQQQGS